MQIHVCLTLIYMFLTLIDDHNQEYEKMLRNEPPADEDTGAVEFVQMQGLISSLGGVDLVCPTLPISYVTGTNHGRDWYYPS